MNKRISLFILIILTLSLFGFSPAPVNAQTWWNNNWSYRITIEINRTKILDDFIDFPVLVYLNSSRINWSHVQDDLDDLRFIDGDEVTQLYTELENYTVNDEAWIWVKIPNVYSMGVPETNQSFYLYYGNNAVSSWWNPEDVWESSAVMVQHMRDNPDNAHVMDSTQYDNDGVKKAADEPIETASGKIDSAQSFDGINDRILSDGFTINGYGKLTISVWINFSGSQSQKEIVGWIYNQEAHLTVDVNYITIRLWNGSVVGYATSNIELNDGLWHHIVGTYDKDAGANNVLLYVNGVVQIVKSTITGVLVVPDVFGIGGFGYGSGGRYFDGILDEIRIYNEAKSVGWILADYYSGSDNLLIYGAETLVPLALTVRYNIGINKLYINGTQRANNTTIYIDQNTTVNATAISQSNYIFYRHILGLSGVSLIPMYLFNMTQPFTLWSYATPNFYIYEEPTTFTFTHWLILLFIALVISLLAAIKFHIIATVSLILVLYMVINVSSYTGIILLAIIVWLLTIMFSIIAFGEI